MISGTRPTFRNAGEQHRPQEVRVALDGRLAEVEHQLPVLGEVARVDERDVGVVGDEVEHERVRDERDRRHDEEHDQQATRRGAIADGKTSTEAFGGPSAIVPASMRPPRALAARGALLGASAASPPGSSITRSPPRARAPSCPSAAGSWRCSSRRCTAPPARVGLRGARARGRRAALGDRRRARCGAPPSTTKRPTARAGPRTSSPASALAGAGRCWRSIRSSSGRCASSTIARSDRRRWSAPPRPGSPSSLRSLTLLGAAALSPLVRVGPRARAALRRAGRRSRRRRLDPRALPGRRRRRGAAVPARSAARACRRRTRRSTPALWAPVIIAVCVGVAHAIGRRLPLRESRARRRAARSSPSPPRSRCRWRSCSSPSGSWCASSICVRSPRLAVDARRRRGARCGPISATPLRKRSLGLRAAVAVAAPALLLAVALGVGRTDRVRKAAIGLYRRDRARSCGVIQPPPISIATATRRCSAAATATTSIATSTPAPSTGPTTASTRTATATRRRCARRRARRFAAVPAAVPRDFERPAHHHRHAARRSRRRLRLRAPDHAATSTRSPPKARSSTNGWAHAPSTRYSMPAILTGR